MEELVLDLFKSEMVQEPKKSLLGEMLSNNQFTRKIDRRILARMNAIRDLGNLGPHPGPVVPDDATKVLAGVCDILEFSLATSNSGGARRSLGRDRWPPPYLLSLTAGISMIVVAVVNGVAEELPAKPLKWSEIQVVSEPTPRSLKFQDLTEANFRPIQSWIDEQDL